MLIADAHANAHANADADADQGGLEKEVSDLKITCQMVEKRAQEQKQVKQRKISFNHLHLIM